MVVTETSAQLFLSNEQRIPIAHNHSDIVKFLNSSDGTYRTVVTKIQECVETERGMRLILPMPRYDAFAEHPLI